MTASVVDKNIFDLQRRRLECLIEPESPGCICSEAGMYAGQRLNRRVTASKQKT